MRFLLLLVPVYLASNFISLNPQYIDLGDVIGTPLLLVILWAIYKIIKWYYLLFMFNLEAAKSLKRVGYAKKV